jgi:uncharacterized protein YjbI with pentapeptide repeats
MDLNLGLNLGQTTAVAEPAPEPAAEPPKVQQPPAPEAAKSPEQAKLLEITPPESHAVDSAPKADTAAVRPAARAIETAPLQAPPVQAFEEALALLQESVVEMAEDKAQAGPPSELEETIEQHRLWLQSGGVSGRQADLSRQDLRSADMTDLSLREAQLNKTILRGADLMLTDLQGASLLQADLRGANLLGAKFQDANLQGAVLEGTSGVQSQQFAGANLFGAALPAEVSIGRGLQHILGLARLGEWLILALVLVVGGAWIRITTTTDIQLLTNAPVIPLSGLQNLMPLVAFYLCGPALLLGLYVCFHLCLQRLWDGAASQPAILPDGRRLDNCLPWFARWPARARLRWLKDQNPTLASLEAGVSMLLLYWAVPATLVLFWGRYLTLQDLRGSMLHVILVAASSWAAIFFTRAACRAYRNSAAAQQSAKTAWVQRAVAPGLGLALALLSLGAVRGIPHADSSLTARGGWSPRTWASDVLWWVGYTPTAHMAESDVSTKPAGFRGRDEDLAQVEGARLSGLRLRYIQAYGAFFAKAHLWQADLGNAYLSEADLREANLRQANLQAASLDRARLNRAVLQEARLAGANLTQAELLDTDASRASLAGALLPDAKLDGANLYASDLQNAVLQRASLQHADLREAKLQGANLSMAILRQAYLSSAKMEGAQLRAAQLAQAFLTQTDLKRADLRGAGLQGAILNGADLTGANLQEVDLRGALGLTAQQICSAATVRGINLDEMLRLEVEMLCGLNR